MPAPSPGSDPQRQIAVFIDFENIALGLRDPGAPFEVRRILDRLLEKGKVLVKVAYADWGRFRADANVQMRIEIVKDFFFELGFYGNYDNQAKEEGGESYDYGVTTSLGYTF